jgi:hypothetical protein
MTEELRTRILNWATWARDHKIIPVSCRSLESKHIARYAASEYLETKVSIDLNDALQVERILTNPTFPKAHMATIVYVYVYPWLNFHAALRRINHFNGGRTINRNNFDEFQRKSEIILENRL